MTRTTLCLIVSLKKGLLDREWYLAAYPDVAAAAVDPLRHYLDFGAAEGRAPNALFDTSTYLIDNPDVAKSGMNPLLHYFLHGIFEGRNGAHFNVLPPEPAE